MIGMVTQLSSLEHKVGFLDPARGAWARPQGGPAGHGDGNGPNPNGADAPAIMIGPVGNVLNNPRLFEDKLAMDGKFRLR